jgi:two-component system LytT family response regulator
MLNLNEKVKVVGLCHQIDDAQKMIEKLKPDLVLSDIKLSATETGFDLLDRLENPSFKLIFITAFNDYALKAFKYNAIDYILKPIDPDELDEAIDRASNMASSEDSALQIDSLVKFMHSKSFAQKKVLFRTAEQIRAVDIDEIIRLESDNNYTQVYLNGGKVLTVSKTLKEYSDILEERGFFRVHQSHLINLNYFELFEKQDGGYIVLKDGSQIPVSKRKKQLLLSFLETL